MHSTNSCQSLSILSTHQPTEFNEIMNAKFIRIEIAYVNNEPINPGTLDKRNLVAKGCLNLHISTNGILANESEDSGGHRIDYFSSKCTSDYY